MSRRTLAVVFGVVLVVVVSILSACGEATETTSAPSATEPAPERPTQPPEATTLPTVRPTAAPPTEQPTLPEGEALVQERCTVCHNLGRIQQAAKTEDEWRTTVTRMIGRGAELNEVEREAVIQYLSETYGP